MNFQAVLIAILIANLLLTLGLVSYLLVSVHRISHRFFKGSNYPVFTDISKNIEKDLKIVQEDINSHAVTCNDFDILNFILTEIDEDRERIFKKYAEFCRLEGKALLLDQLKPST